MRHHFWTVLFGIVFIFSAIREHQFVLIYYTVWTFILELVYFLCKSLNLSSIADILWPFLLAPSIVVCVGFWIIVAPMQFMHHPPENIVMVFVTHGLNMVAAILEKKKVDASGLSLQFSRSPTNIKSRHKPTSNSFTF